MFECAGGGAKETDDLILPMFCPRSTRPRPVKSVKECGRISKGMGISVAPFWGSRTDQKGPTSEAGGAGWAGAAGAAGRGKVKGRPKRMYFCTYSSALLLYVMLGMVDSRLCSVCLCEGKRRGHSEVWREMGEGKSLSPWCSVRVQKHEPG